MSETIRALVIEDDPNIREEIEDVLAAMNHQHDWAESQQEARELVEKNCYHYVLADLEIPARPGRGFAKIDYGRQLIEQIQQINGRGVVPVVIMTGHHKEGLDLTMELLGNGAMDFISKPFGDGTSDRSLSQVIQGVLAKHRKVFPAGSLPGDPPTPFRGGVLAYYEDHIELLGETILEAGGAGHSWEVMQAFRKRRPTGKLPRYSAPKLADAVDSTGQVTEGAVASCVHDLRVRVCNVMLERANVVVGREDVITNKGAGYHLAEWLTVEDGVPTAKSITETSRGHDVGTLAAPRGDANPKAVTPAGGEPLTDRQHWILGQLRDGVKLTRAMVQAQFGIREKQAKRALADLSNRSLTDFIRKPRPGYYVLRSKPTQRASTIS